MVRTRTWNHEKCRQSDLKQTVHTATTTNCNGEKMKNDGSHAEDDSDHDSGYDKEDAEEVEAVAVSLPPELSSSSCPVVCMCRTGKVTNAFPLQQK